MIGAGIVGLATADALLERGEDVVVYEMAQPGQGQSSGESRLFRHAHDDPRLVRLAIESREIWRRLEERFGEELISRDGLVALGEVAVKRLETLNELGVPAMRIDSAELAERQPLLAGFEGDAVLDETGGSIRTGAAVRLLGGHVGFAIVPCGVLSLSVTDAGRAEVRIAGERFEHERVIVCAGRGTAPLAHGAGLSLPVSLSCHIRATFAVRGEVPERIACLQDGAGEWGETGVYGAPQPGNERFGVGLAETMDVREDGSVVDPASFNELGERTAAYVAKAMPGLDPEPVGLLHCWVTELPWNEDAYAIWEHGPLLFSAGHNLWKMAPVLGGALADAATGNGIRPELREEARLGDRV